MIERESIIQQYFKMWLIKNDAGLETIMADSVYYCESYGPEYHGLTQIHQWFTDWNNQGTVLLWKIKQFIHSQKITAVEWYFECNFNGETSGFDGVSLVEFNQSGKIASIKEFQSKAEHNQPYQTK